MMMDRRTFLRGAGVALALPALESFGADLAPAPRRMVAIATTMGLLPQYFFPKASGRDYELTPYLEIFREHRKDLTVFSGLSHPNVDGGHAAERSFLTAAPHPGGGAFRNSVSVDQVAAEHLGTKTRFPSLVLCAFRSKGCSFTRSGVAIPPMKNPGDLYRKLFVQGSPADVERTVERLRQGRSLLDAVRDRAKALDRELGRADRERMEQYLTSVRDLEADLHASEAWERRPRPKPVLPPPKELKDKNDVVGQLRRMFGVLRLAIETDSTRVISYCIEAAGTVPTLPGATQDIHSLTHQPTPEGFAELRIFEEAMLREVSAFLADLKGVREGDGSLLDRTAVLFGSSLSNGAAHSNTNLPILLAGGGFRHGQHLVFDRDRNYPLPNLYVSLLQRLGIEVDRFASSTGTVRGLEMI
jgi:hypothetical protein